MTQEDRKLLRKDVYARIPYGVKGIDSMGNISSPKDWRTEFTIEIIVNCSIAKYEWKPYLFPLSSMTKKQKLEYRKTKWIYQADYCAPQYFDGIESFDWLIRNHFDYRGLIPMGLALDATGLNIY